VKLEPWPKPAETLRAARASVLVDLIITSAPLANTAWTSADVPEPPRLLTVFVEVKVFEFPELTPVALSGSKTL
jgi:hypothetical protein